MFEVEFDAMSALLIGRIDHYLIVPLRQNVDHTIAYAEGEIKEWSFLDEVNLCEAAPLLNTLATDLEHAADLADTLMDAE